MAKTFYRQDLDATACTTPGCLHTGGNHAMDLYSRCHPGMPLIASYHAGTLSLSCTVCDEPVVTIAVADRPAVPERGNGSVA